MSWIGIGLAAVTAMTMPLLANAKQGVGRKLNSSATVSEASQNMICAYGKSFDQPSGYRVELTGRSGA